MPKYIKINYHEFGYTGIEVSENDKAGTDFQ
jgi:hypothetical protein